MRQIVALAIMVLAASSATVRAASGGVVVRARLDTAGPVVIGQPAKLLVDVLFPEAMVRPPRVTMPDVAGAQVFSFRSQGLTIRERIEATSYIGQEFEFVVIPRRGGKLTLPAADVVLLDRSGDVTGSAEGEPLTMVVAVPAGIDPSGPVIASDKVTARQAWSPAALTKLEAGQAAVRTIERGATGVPAVGLANLVFAAPEGVRVYADAPLSDDRVERGEVTGRRIDKVTYVFERPGTYALPAVSQPWWDLDAKEARVETLPGVEIVVVANGSFRKSAARRGSAKVLAGAGFAVAALALAAWLRPRLGMAWQSWRTSRLKSEAWARRQVRMIAVTGGASATYRAMTVWLERLHPGEKETVLDRDPELQRLVKELNHALFGNGLVWSPDRGRQLARAVSAARLGLGHARRSSALPPLNPPVA